jgi:peptide-methionine (S)-S-oxide reductase
MDMRLMGLRPALGTFLVAVLGIVGLSGAAFPDPPKVAAAPVTATSEKAVLAGGCFWGMEAVFESLKGVSRAVSGYSGGSKETAQYETVSSGRTGHAESVEVTFDPSVIPFGEILRVYFSVAHDPTELNRQGPDEGTQYRSAIFYADDVQKRVAEAYIRELNAAKVFKAPIVTQVVRLQKFYPAEAYHQHFVQKNPNQPYVASYDIPKLAHLRQQYPALLK